MGSSGINRVHGDSTPTLIMDSSVTAILLASFLASASSQFDCPLVDSFCDPEDAQYDLGELTGDNLLPTATATDASEECYNLCNAESGPAADPKCEDFTVLKIGNRPPKCYLLREPCITNIHDDCIAKGNCISGPNDCTEVPQTCPVVASLPEGFSRWQCVDINMEPINPYSVQPPVGTICYQTCPSWTDASGNSARLVSVCEEGASVGAWSEALNVDGQELAYPKYPMDGTFDTSYPTPDMDQDSAMACGCEPLEVRWPYEGGDYYDPNAEPAADFICNTEVDISTNEYKIDTTNVCVLYCDDHYVATAKCQNGEWLGNPEWGFWCYEEPTALAGGEATTPDPATPPAL